MATSSRARAPRRLAIAAAALSIATLASLTLASARAETPVERGRYLVRGIGTCGNCHAATPAGEFPSADRPLSGGNAILAPIFRAYPSNITPDKATGIGNWTADQIVVAMRDGKRPDGSLVRPPMPVPFIAHISDDDAQAVAAYLLTLPAVNHKVPDSTYKVPMPPSYGPPVGHVTAPPTSDKAAYGGYLAAIGHCLECHTPLAQGRPDMAKLGAGGRLLEEETGQATSANITPDKDTGIGTWSDAQIIKALTTGERPDGRLLGRPMPWYFYQNMTPQDLDALVAWLHTLKPVANKVTR